MRARPFLFLFFVLPALGACKKDQSPPPPPSVLTDAANDYYSEMTIVAHFGPKGQVHLLGQKAPLWFSSVHKTIAYILSPERDKKVAAIYVSDMAKTSNWNMPDPRAWVDARKAWYVIDGKINGKRIVGGMGMPEVVPFSDKSAAQMYAREHDGEVVPMDDIPPAYFSPPPPPPNDESNTCGVHKT